MCGAGAWRGQSRKPTGSRPEEGSQQRPTHQHPGLGLPTSRCARDELLVSHCSPSPTAPPPGPWSLWRLPEPVSPPPRGPPSTASFGRTDAWQAPVVPSNLSGAASSNMGLSGAWLGIRSGRSRAGPPPRAGLGGGCWTPERGRFLLGLGRSPPAPQHCLASPVRQLLPGSLGHPGLRPPPLSLP